MDDKSRYEILVGLHVTDDNQYDLYRAAMTPLLEKLDGFFRYDFRVSEMLKGEADESYNRVFVISFPDQAIKDQFFGDEQYLAIRNEFFEPSVSASGIIAAYTI